MMSMMQNHTTIPIPIPAVFIPVIYFDGEREANLGNIEITPSMTYKSFQSHLSNKLSISPHQITTYFERTNLYPHPTTNRRRHPVTNKFDFPSLVLDCKTGLIPAGSYFWVVSKRSRRTRRRRNGPNRVIDENFVLLRRGESDWVVPEYVDIIRVQQMERYLMSLNLNSNVYSDLSLSGFNNNNNHHHGNSNQNYYYDGNYDGTQDYARSFTNSDDGATSTTTGATSTSWVFCEVCDDCSAEDAVPFHWCKNDVVMKEFKRSTAGPIAPPSKSLTLS